MKNKAVKNIVCTMLAVLGCVGTGQNSAMISESLTDKNSGTSSSATGIMDPFEGLKSYGLNGDSLEIGQFRSEFLGQNGPVENQQEFCDLVRGLIEANGGKTVSRPIRIKNPVDHTIDYLTIMAEIKEDALHFTHLKGGYTLEHYLQDADKRTGLAYPGTDAWVQAQLEELAAEIGVDTVRSAHAAGNAYCPDRVLAFCMAARGRAFEFAAVQYEIYLDIDETLTFPINPERSSNVQSAYNKIIMSGAQDLVWIDAFRYESLGTNEEPKLKKINVMPQVPLYRGVWPQVLAWLKANCEEIQW